LLLGAVDWCSSVVDVVMAGRMEEKEARGRALREAVRTALENMMGVGYVVCGESLLEEMWVG
jgi:hypothetical protein